ncbi:hypothetical protein OH77DRAFT_1435943 [Trametes cingulata]|nr:hypothetical protein OH77DRAFT_1435943 [Trametes cingulata]
MSSAATESGAQQIIANHAFFFIEDCANFAQAALIFYEYFITFASEIRLIWRRKITGASVIFFLNRYIMVFQNGITVASYWPLPNLSCDALAWMDIVLSLLPYFVWNGWYQSTVFWASVSLSLTLSMRPLNEGCADWALAFATTPENMPPPYNCNVNNTVSIAVDNKLVLVSRLTLIAADSIVLIVTWWKTYRLKKAADAARVKTSIVDLLLRDGTIYFGCVVRHSLFSASSTMLVLNLLHIMINHVEQVSFMGDIISVLTSILVSRFIMNLRDIDGKDTGQISRTEGGAVDGIGTWHAGPGAEGWTASEQRGTIVFARAGEIVDSMGGPLEHSMARLEDDDSWIEGSEEALRDDEVEEPVEDRREGEKGDGDGSV